MSLEPMEDGYHSSIRYGSQSSYAGHRLRVGHHTGRSCRRPSPTHHVQVLLLLPWHSCNTAMSFIPSTAHRARYNNSIVDCGSHTTLPHLILRSFWSIHYSDMHVNSLADALRQGDGGSTGVAREFRPQSRKAGHRSPSENT